MFLRLKLENFIFYRADYLNVCVYGWKGRLYSHSLDPYLQITIYLYNCSFAPPKSGAEPLCPYQVWGGIKNGWILPPLSIDKSYFVDKNIYLC